MVNKISLYVFVAELFRKFNFLIPDTMCLDIAKRLIVKIINKTVNTEINADEYELLNVLNGMYVSKDFSLKDAGITDGTELLLVGGNNGGHKDKPCPSETASTTT